MRSVLCSLVSLLFLASVVHAAQIFRLGGKLDVNGVKVDTPVKEIRQLDFPDRNDQDEIIPGTHGLSTSTSLGGLAQITKDKKIGKLRNVWVIDSETVNAKTGFRVIEDGRDVPGGRAAPGHRTIAITSDISATGAISAADLLTAFQPAQFSGWRQLSLAEIKQAAEQAGETQGKGKGGNSGGSSTKGNASTSSKGNNAATTSKGKNTTPPPVSGASSSTKANTTRPKSPTKQPAASNGSPKQPGSPSTTVKRPSSPKPATKRPASPKPAVKPPTVPKPAVKRPVSPKATLKRPTSPAKPRRMLKTRRMM